MMSTCYVPNCFIARCFVLLFACRFRVHFATSSLNVPPFVRQNPGGTLLGRISLLQTGHFHKRCSVVKNRCLFARQSHLLSRHHKEVVVALLRVPNNVVSWTCSNLAGSANFAMDHCRCFCWLQGALGLPMQLISDIGVLR